MPERQGLVIAAKSAWAPPIRREHALAALASRHGHAVTFVEAADDIRTLRRAPREWVAHLARPARRRAGPGVEVHARCTLLPAHVNRISESLDARLLHRAISRSIEEPAPAVAVTFPWHWPAVSRLAGVRKVLDVGDDWGALIPGRARRVRELYKQAAEEADSISVASDQLQGLFGGRKVTVVRNAVADELLRAPLSRAPGTRRLVYVGTLSERFDATLAGRLLDLLPGWRLDLFGDCSYARMGTRPGPELARLLSREDRRAAWQGPVARDQLAGVLDGADVLLLPNRAQQSRGQDSMKVYDYAARGRPTVATAGATAAISEPPPHLRSGDDADALAALVCDALSEPPAWMGERAAWAAAQSWDARWPRWSRVMFGAGGDGEGEGEMTLAK